MSPTATEHWNDREFMAFLLLYASKADSKTTEDEVQFIVSHFGADAYDNVLPSFEKQSDYDSIQTIVALKERFYPGTVGKEAIRTHLTGLFMADGHFSAMERVVMNALERLFD